MNVRIGIIGTGSIVDDCHVPAVMANSDLSFTSLLTRDPEHGKLFLERHNSLSTKIYTNIDGFVSDENVDCIIAASPDRLHFEHAIKSIHNGKNILLEKPMVTSLGEADEMSQALSNSNSMLAIGFHLRFHNGLQKLYHEIHTNKKIGNIKHIRALWTFPQIDSTNWRANNTLGKWWSLAAVGAHCFDLIRWF